MFCSANVIRFFYISKYLLKKNMKKQIIKLTESELHSIINETVKRILSENYYKQDDNDASWDAFERTMQPVTNYTNKGELETYFDEPNSWYGIGRGIYDEVMGDDGYEEKLDDFLGDYHQFSKDDNGFNGIQAQKDGRFYKDYYQDRFSRPKKIEKFK